MRSFTKTFYGHDMLTLQAAPFALSPLEDGHVTRFVEDEDRWYRGWRALVLLSIVPWAGVLVAGIALSVGSPTSAINTTFWLILGFGLLTTTGCYLMARRHKDNTRVLNINDLTGYAWIEQRKRGRVIETSDQVMCPDVQVITYPVMLKGFGIPLKFKGHGLVAHCGDAWIVLGVAASKEELGACIDACSTIGLTVGESEELISSELNIRITAWRRGLKQSR